MRLDPARTAATLSLAVLLVAAAVRPVPAVEAISPRPPVPDDAALAVLVERRLAGRPDLDASGVSVTVRGGVLLLEGEVASLRARRRAEGYAAGVRGILGMENRLAIRGRDVPDGLLETEARRALESVPRLKKLGIAVTASGGVLQLSGEVPLARDRLDAEEEASGVSGVTSIENGIRVTAVAVDPELIRRRIENLLGNRLLFGGVESLKVSVSDSGDVILEGAVTHQADRLRAERLAWGVRGVATVRNDLVVRRFDPPRTP